MRIGRRARAGLVFAGLAVAGVGIWACADAGESATWELAKDYYDVGGNGAMLTPGNDTRVNLMLLLADRRRMPVRHAATRTEDPPRVLFPWRAMAEAAAPPVAEEEETVGGEPSRCQSNVQGTAAFLAALRANSEVTPQERQSLEAARTSFEPACSGGENPAPPAVATSTAAGAAFAAYLAGTGHFYGGRFDAARSAFAALGKAPDPWLRETALYMVARTELNDALQFSFTEYGGLAEPEQRDRVAIDAAGAAFAAYLNAYAKGRYAASARGLTRRVAWLAGDHEALAAAFARVAAAPDAMNGTAAAAALSAEIDHALLETGGGGSARDPLLLAVHDLQRMRCIDDYETQAKDCGPRIGREELERQAPLFASEPALFGYLRGAEAFFVRGAHREVLSLIPDAAHQPSFTYVEFSRQALRGMALEATGDRNARAFWLSLLPGAVQPYQREALELALALHDERTGQLARIFEPGSQVRHPVMRQLLLEHVAGPDLLRRRAEDAAAPRQEREVAAYILLAKQLRRGFYRDFLRDLRFVPADAPADTWYGGAAYWDTGYNSELPRPPVGVFSAKASTGEAGCSALAETVAQLAASPEAIGARLCLAEFFRSNGFDQFAFDEKLGGTGLATSRPQFPGGPYHRLEVYKSVIGDPKAAPEQRALALNRAIRCYQPTGSNSCGGEEVSLSQRRAWYLRLKREFPDSTWARSLKYYW